MAKRRREYRTRVAGGRVQQLCSDRDCPVGWQDVVEFFSASGERYVKCRGCRNDYHRRYLHGRQPLTATSVAKSQRKALEDLCAAWPEPYAEFDDCGGYDYDAPSWRRKPFDYDAAPEPRRYEDYGEDDDGAGSDDRPGDDGHAP